MKPDSAYFLKPKPIEWLLVILLLIAPFYFHHNIGGTGFSIPNNIVVWFIATTIGFYSLYKLSGQPYFYSPPYFSLIIIFPLIASFSGILAGVEIANQWVFRLLYIWGGLLLFFGLYQHQLKQGRIDRILFVIVISGLIHALVGIAQIIFVTNMPSWLPANANGIPTGLFQQINNHASFQVTSILAAFWLVSRPYISHAKKWRFYLILLAIELSMFVLSYSSSRVGALAFLLVLPLFLLSRWHKIKLDKQRWLLIAMVVVASILATNVIHHKRGDSDAAISSVVDKTTAINAGFSGSARLGIYTIAYNAFKEQPIFGHGIGSFIRVWQLGKPQFYAEHPDAFLPNNLVTHPHNEVIFWLMEGGSVAGSGLFFVLIAVILSLKKLPPSRRYVYAAFLIPITLHTQVELPFYISAIHWFVFLILLFIVMHPYNRKRRLILSDAARKLIKVVTLLGGITAIVFFSHTMASNLEFKRFALKQSSPTNPFPLATKNPYFELLANEVMVISLFFTSLEYRLDENVRAFADWSEQELKTNPHIVYYRLTSEALIYLHEKPRACDITLEGLTVYPDDTKLQDILKQCQELNI